MLYTFFYTEMLKCTRNVYIGPICLYDTIIFWSNLRAYIQPIYIWKIIYIFAAAATAAKSLQSCPTLCDPIDCSPPGSPVPGILQAKILEWGAIYIFKSLYIFFFGSNLRAYIYLKDIYLSVHLKDFQLL